MLETPAEAELQTKYYLAICFAGAPFIVAYNVIASIFRGLGDSRSPMYFVIIAGIINILLDVLFIGPMDMKAAGAALATIIAQAISVLAGVISLARKNRGFNLRRDNFRLNRRVFSDVIKVGVPVSLQDGLIQVSFLVITIIANSRGVMTAAAVGIVEKIISFLFLVPSAMLSSISAIAAQNAGAGKHQRSRLSLRYGITITVVFGRFCGRYVPDFFRADCGAVLICGAAGDYAGRTVPESLCLRLHLCGSAFLLQRIFLRI